VEPKRRFNEAAAALAVVELACPPLLAELADDDAAELGVDVLAAVLGRQPLAAPAARVGEPVERNVLATSLPSSFR
jgi:hypothetical protein